MLVARGSFVSLKTAREIQGPILVCVSRDRWSIVHGCWLLARAEVAEGRRHAAKPRREPGAQRRIRHRQGEADSLFAEGEIASSEGRGQDARALVDESRRIRIEIGDRPEIVECDAALSRMTTKELA
jgi:hypothetical protein